ncbi:MAG: MCP four helix bundle domain-containing protein [Polyangiales bacterium]
MIGMKREYYLATATMALACAAAGGVGVYSARGVQQRADSLYDNYTLPMREIGRAQADLQTLRQTQSLAARSASLEQFERLHQEGGRLIAEYRAALRAELGSNLGVSRQGHDERANAEAASRAGEAYFAAWERMMGEARAALEQGATPDVASSTAAAEDFDASVTSMATLAATVAEISRELHADNGAAYAHTRRVCPRCSSRWRRCCWRGRRGSSRGATARCSRAASSSSSTAARCCSPPRGRSPRRASRWPRASRSRRRRWRRPLRPSRRSRRWRAATPRTPARPSRRRATRARRPTSGATRWPS